MLQVTGGKVLQVKVSFLCFYMFKPRVVGESVAFCFMLHFSHGCTMSRLDVFWFCCNIDVDSRM